MLSRKLSADRRRGSKTRLPCRRGSSKTLREREGSHSRTMFISPSENHTDAMPMARIANSEPSTWTLGPTSVTSGASAVPESPASVWGAMAPFIARTHRQYRAIAATCAAILPWISARALGSRWSTTLAELPTDRWPKYASRTTPKISRRIDGSNGRPPSRGTLTYVRFAH